MIANPARQQGMTAIGWLLVLAIAGFFVLLVLRLAPAYMENYSIKMALESLENDPQAPNMSIQEVRRRLNAKLNVNYVTDLPKDAIKLKKAGGFVTVEVDYEVRKPVVANVDAVISFSDRAELIPH